MKKIHAEFAYQSRELGIQIEDTLGDPPDRKTYAKVVKSLIDEFANGSEIDDVNLLAFALVDHLRFIDIPGLFTQCEHYDQGDTAKVLSMVACNDDAAGRAVIAVAASRPELARRAIITAFLYKNPKRWTEEDHSLESLGKNDNGDDEEEDQLTAGHNIEHLFDGEQNAG
ncbi:MAG TPA: hypothetical protein DE312_09985 [Gallionella sp.]|jgi:hypothetical protein|nr:hypothetical protein [Gallionella sp.]OGS68122.1 MAG: hypothetical protein A2Z87_12275 [Gallionellales bacterium GWA2_54_124]HCI53624.1 hypothetical protein [Gallionella sp.]